MKKFAFVILILLPLIGFSQAEKRYRSIIIDSIKALNGNIIEIKDFAEFDTSISIGGNIEPSAIANFVSIKKGFLMPRVTTTQRDNIPSPAEGLMVYNTTTNAFNVFDVGWQTVGAAGNTIYNADDNLSSNRTVTMGANSLTFSGNQTTFKGVDATSSNFVFTAEDNVNTKLLRVRNDGKVFINTSTAPFGSLLSIETESVGVTVSTTEISGNFFLGISSTNKTLHNMFVDGTNTIYALSNSAGQNIIRLGSDFSNLNQMTIGVLGAPPSGGSALEVNNAGDVLLNSGNANNNSTKNSGILTFSGNYDSDPSGSVVATDFDATIQTIVTVAGSTPEGRLAFGVEATEALSIDQDGDVKINNSLATTGKSLTLGAVATTFVISSNVFTLTGDSGGNTIATITGANDGHILTIIFTDGNVTITDNNAHDVDSIDLSAAFTSADDTTIQILYDGTSWYETSRSVN